LRYSKLYTQNMKTFEKFEPHYKFMLNAFESGNMKDLEEYAIDNAGDITKLFLKFGDYGHSRNNEFDKYLNSFQEVALHLDNIVLWVKKEELNSHTKRYLISNCFRDAKLHFNRIKEQAMYWKKTINLSEDEYNKIDPEKIKRQEYQYKQTIPLNPDGLDVTFNLDISQNIDNTLNIRGTTNLFDKASLMISLRNSKGLLLAQNKSLVENGIFDFGKLGKKGIGFDKGKYKVDITLTYGEATNIEAESINRNIEGTIEGFTLGDELSITVLTTDNTRETLIISPDARIRIDGEYKTIDDISLGMKGYYVDIRVESDVVIRMNIETKEAEGEVRGTVKHFNTDAMLIVVETEIYIDGKRQVIDKVVFYDDDTLFVEGRDTIKSRYLDRYLESGDTVTVFGKYQVDGTFLAELVKW